MNKYHIIWNILVKHIWCLHFWMEFIFCSSLARVKKGKTLPVGWFFSIVCWGCVFVSLCSGFVNIIVSCVVSEQQVTQYNCNCMQIAWLSKNNYSLVCTCSHTIWYWRPLLYYNMWLQTNTSILPNRNFQTVFLLYWFVLINYIQQVTNMQILWFIKNNYSFACTCSHAIRRPLVLCMRLQTNTCTLPILNPQSWTPSKNMIENPRQKMVGCVRHILHRPLHTWDHKSYDHNIA